VLRKHATVWIVLIEDGKHEFDPPALRVKLYGVAEGINRFLVFDAFRKWPAGLVA